VITATLGETLLLVDTLGGALAAAMLLAAAVVVTEDAEQNLGIYNSK
jgi:hypothetical protein